MCHCGCEDHLQHCPRHRPPPLHLRRHRGAAVQGEVLDVLRPDPARGGDLPGRVLRLQGRGHRRPDRGGAETLDQERVQLRQRHQGHAYSLRSRHIRGLAGVRLDSP